MASSVDTLTSAPNTIAQLPSSARKGIWQQIEEDQYRIRKEKSGVAYHAPNRAQAYRTEFDKQGPGIRLDNGAPTLTLSLVYVAQGDRKIQPALLAIEPDAEQTNKVNYRREQGVTEWYVNRASGIEQGFTFSRPLARSGSSLRLVLASSPQWRVSQQGENIRFTHDDASISYRDVKAWDADSKPLSAHMSLDDAQHLILTVATANARYPIQVDPTIQNEDKKLTRRFDNLKFGYATALSGDTLAVGVRGDTNNGTDSGSVYLFSRNLGGADNWGQIKKVTASDGAAGDLFGYAVALDVDTLVVGARLNDGKGQDAGAAYVFMRNEGGTGHWGEVKKLTGRDTTAGDDFGVSVAVSGTTIIVGARMDDDAGEASGSAYVFNKDQSGANNWGQLQKLTAADAAAGDQFGVSVSLSFSTSTIVIGAYLDNDQFGVVDAGSAYVFGLTPGGWSQTTKLLPPDIGAGDRFGVSVDIDGDVIAVGAYFNDDSGMDSGSAYVYGRNIGSPGAWGLYDKIVPGSTGDRAGISVSISGNTVMIGGYLHDEAATNEVGVAWIYSGNIAFVSPWRVVKKLLASDGAANDRLGISVAIDGTTAVAGAYQDDGLGANAGSAYIFYRDQGALDNWGQIKKLAAGDSAIGDEFGHSLAINRDTLAVGVWGDDDNGSNSGSVYLFQRAQSGVESWQLTRKIKENEQSAGDQFGAAIALDGDTLVVGSPFDDGSTNFSGAAYVFKRNQGGNYHWGQVKKLTASDGAGGDNFGASVAINGDNLVVGADQPGANGAAYVFGRNQGGTENWGEIKKLISGDSASGDRFGQAVAINGNTVAVGAPFHDSNNLNWSGAAYVFARNQGGANNWGAVKQLTASDNSASRFFGNSVVNNGDEIIVGADGFGGGAYVFQANRGGANNWGESKKILPSDGSIGEFGYAIAMDDDTLIVGARLDNANGALSSGSAYVFVRDNGGTGNWGEIKKLLPTDGASGDNFGGAVAIHKDTMVVGAPFDGDNGADSGSAYVFNLPMRITEVALQGSLHFDQISADHSSTIRAKRLRISLSATPNDPPGNNGANDASNPALYALYTAGPDGVPGNYSANTCLSGLTPAGDDGIITIDSANYIDFLGAVNLDVNGGAELDYGSYTLIVCGSSTSAIRNTYNTPLDGNGDRTPGDDYVLRFKIEQESICFPIKTRNGNLAVVCL